MKYWNALGGDQYNEKQELIVGNVITNAMFQFPRSAPILEVALSSVSRLYDPASWTSLGPDILQRSLLTLCGFPPSQPLRELAMTRTRLTSLHILTLHHNYNQLISL